MPRATQQFLRRPLFGGNWKLAQRRLIVGVAPGGTHEVVVHTRGAVSTAPVRDEIFVLRDTTLAPPDTISLR